MDFAEDAFVPVLAQGEAVTAVPIYLLGEPGINAARTVLSRCV
ncbi:MAG: hypothetical protein ACSLE6_00810 [Mycobacterium sp.]